MKKPRILVVDNELDICNFVKSFFEMRGFEVFHALNGDEAMAKLSLQPDLIMLDVKMRREEEGLEYLPQIHRKLPNSKIIMITGVDDAEVVKAAKELGADDYITKPLMLEYLETTVLSKVKNLGVAAA